MKVGWLIDAGMFDAYREELVSCMRAQGHAVEFVNAPGPPYRWDDVGSSYRKAFAAGACVVAHGDIELVTRIRNEARWTPGVFATVENLACSRYYCDFGEYLLAPSM